jgi:cobalt-zinc-cadmium efflux system protein
MKTASLAARILLGAIFLYASYDKILHPEAFSAIIFNYKILPPQMVNLAAIILPWLEAVCGAALVLGVNARGAAALTALLTTVFMAALGFNLMRGIDVQCGCFSAAPAEANTAFDLARDAVIFLLALYVLASQRDKPKKTLY